MRVNVLALALLCVSVTAGSSHAGCTRPDAPTCAIQLIPFAKDQDADDCRKDMLRFRGAMDVYASCLGTTSTDQEKKARDEYEDIRVRFNRRARGEL
jgi:hypothetical protein